MVNSPLVTVLMTVYNGEKCLAYSIESVLNQTFKDFEFLIINDASTDKSLSVIESYKDERIRLYTNERNIGQTKSLNVGLKLARGKYIARTDADDASLPMRLERQVSYMEKNPKITVLGASAYQYDETWRVFNLVHMPKSSKAIIQRIFFASPLVHVSALMNRQAVLASGGYNEAYDILADYELWSRLIHDGHYLSNTREVLVGYMVSSASFGAMNMMNKSITEAAKIIQTNVDKFTGVSISFTQATNIYRLFALNMVDLPLDDIKKTEVLISKIYKNINISQKDVDYYLLRSYLKYVLINLRNPQNISVLRHAGRSIFLRIGCLFSYEKLTDSLWTLYQKILFCRRPEFGHLVYSKRGTRSYLR